MLPQISGFNEILYVNDHVKELLVHLRPLR